MAQLIGLTGYAGSGKDTAAEALLAHGFERRAFADPLRECVRKLNPFVTMNGEPTQRISAVVASLGWDRAKREIPEVRRLLQVFGTEVVRDTFGRDTWVNVCRDSMLNGVDYVVTDVRFPNEVEMIHRAGGIVVKVMRPGVRPVNAHASDDIDGLHADYTVMNDGSIEQLHAWMIDLVGIEAEAPTYGHVEGEDDELTGGYFKRTPAELGRVEGEDIEALERAAMVELGAMYDAALRNTPGYGGQA